MSVYKVCCLGGALVIAGCVAPSQTTLPGPSGARFSEAKCSGSSEGCLEEAAATCRGPYQVMDSYSSAGGLLSDSIPGPVTWYTMSYQCGASDGRLPEFRFRGDRYVPPSSSGSGTSFNPTYMSPSQMTDYCRGEAAGRFDTRPAYVSVGSAQRGIYGGYIVTGSVDQDFRGSAPFECRFDRDGRFDRLVEL